MLPTCKWWAEVSKLKSLHFWWSHTLASYWTTLSPPMTCTRGYLQMEPTSYKRFPCHTLDLACTVKKWTIFISFLFTLISSKPPFKFSLPHPLPSNLAYPHTKMKKESWKEMCVFPKCERLLSLTHTQKKIKSNAIPSLPKKKQRIERLTSSSHYPYFNSPSMNPNN